MSNEFFAAAEMSELCFEVVRRLLIGRAVKMESFELANSGAAITRHLDR